MVRIIFTTHACTQTSLQFIKPVPHGCAGTRTLGRGGAGLPPPQSQPPSRATHLLTDNCSKISDFSRRTMGGGSQFFVTAKCPNDVDGKPMVVSQFKCKSTSGKWSGTLTSLVDSNPSGRGRNTGATCRQASEPLSAVQTYQRSKYA